MINVVVPALSPEIGIKEEEEEEEEGRFLVEKLVAVSASEDKKLKGFSNNNSIWSSSSTSSIGKNSDVSGDTDEVQSSNKGPLDAMEALEEVLPIRRGISSFYNGKSKSFACLPDAPSTSSIKELAKPENGYIRRRRNLLASSSLVLDKNKSSPLKKSNSGGVSKRVSTNNSNRSFLALAVTMNSISNDGSSPSSINQARIHSQLRDYHQFNGSSFSPRRSFPTWRSFSFADLQNCGSVSASACTVTPPPRQSDSDQSQSSTERNLHR